MQETAEEFVESEGGIDIARQYMRGDETVLDDLWDDLAELDYPAVTVPVEYGGFGEGLRYLAALLEATGRYALPGPLPETAAFVAPLIAELGTEAQKERYLPAIADADLTFSFALHDDRTETVPDAIQATAEPADGGYRLVGTKTLVPYGGAVDRVVVAARTRDATGFGGVSLFVVDPSDAEISRLDTLDQTRPRSELDFDGLFVPEADRLGPLHGGGDALSRAIDRYNVAFAAMLVGAAGRAVDLSVEHGNEREQYGHPIGRFQAVKHRIVEMWMNTEHSRSLTYYAAWAMDTDDPDAALAVAMMNAYAGQRLHDVFADGIKNHGGMGFTWDHDGHIYLKQAKTWQSHLGSPGQALDRVADVRNYSEETLPDYPRITTEPYRG
jgi:alkylation response protein AidB-like acyl-CoA dehydrogenase